MEYELERTEQLRPDIPHIAAGDPETMVVQVAASTKLDPGESCLADTVTWTETASPTNDDVWTADSTNQVTIYDPHHLNFLLPTEQVEVRFSQARHRYEVVGSQGLRRKGKIKTGVTISPGGSGEVLVWVQGAATNPNVYITVQHSWIDNNYTLNAGVEVIFEYFRDEDEWHFTDFHC
tara:strand:- start:6168 stop:6701 length:534 start_codon:yes stop_codon:yes gene_type:complete